MLELTFEILVKRLVVPTVLALGPVIVSEPTVPFANFPVTVKDVPESSPALVKEMLRGTYIVLFATKVRFPELPKVCTFPKPATLEFKPTCKVLFNALAVKS